VGPGGERPALERRRLRPWSQGGAARRRARSRRGPGQPRPLGAQGPVRLAGHGVARSAHAATRARERRPASRRLGGGHGRDSRPLSGAPGRKRPRLHRLLHERPALPRGVLHAGRDRSSRDRHEPCGRQHPPVHRDGERGPEADLRLRRAARLLQRRRPLRHVVPGRPQRGGDPARPLDADARPRARPGPAAARRGRSAPHRPRRRGRRPSRGQARGEPRAAERATARADRERPDRPRLDRRPYRRVRRARAGRGALYARPRLRAVRRPGRGHPGGRPDPRRGRRPPLHRPPGRISVEPGHGRRGAGQQHQPHPRDARPSRRRHPADERPADGREHARVRRQRRPPRLS
jgi:hypothetical protein